MSSPRISITPTSSTRCPLSFTSFMWRPNDPSSSLARKPVNIWSRSASKVQGTSQRPKGFHGCFRSEGLVRSLLHNVTMRRLPLLLLLASGQAFAQSAPAVDADGERAMLERINALRAHDNLPPLTRHEGLDAAARAHSVDMASNRQLVHVSARTGDPARRVREAGVSTTRVAENIARHSTTAGAQDSILASDAHRAQVLDPNFTHIGLAAVTARDGIYVTQVMATLAPPPAALPPPSVSEVEPQPEPEAVAATPPPPAQLDTTPDAQPNAQAQPNATQSNAPQQIPTMRMPRTHRRVAGYWIYHGQRWLFFPVPARARPGQVLHPDPNIQGPPPGYQQPAQQQVRPAAPPPVRYRTRPQPQQRQSQDQQRTIYWY